MSVSSNVCGWVWVLEQIHIHTRTETIITTEYIRVRRRPMQQTTPSRASKANEERNQSRLYNWAMVCLNSSTIRQFQLRPSDIFCDLKYPFFLRGRMELRIDGLNQIQYRQFATLAHVIHSDAQTGRLNKR